MSGRTQVRNHTLAVILAACESLRGRTRYGSMCARTQVRSLGSGNPLGPSFLGSDGPLGPSPLGSGGHLGPSPLSSSWILTLSSSWILIEWQIALLNYFDGTWVKESSANTKAN